MQDFGMLCVYTKYLGGFSGGETIASGRWNDVSLERKHRNDSFMGRTCLSNIYLAVKVIVVRGSFPYLQLILLIKVLKRFCFSLLVLNLFRFSSGAQQQCVLQSDSDLQPHWWSLQGNASYFLGRFPYAPPLHNIRDTIIKTWTIANILLLLLIFFFSGYYFLLR